MSILHAFCGVHIRHDDHKTTRKQLHYLGSKEGGEERLASNGPRLLFLFPFLGLTDWV